MDTPNYFEMLGLPQAFHIDEQVLEDQYRNLQSILHPDRYANASNYERRMAAEKSSDINQAYNTLKSPSIRAQHLLEIQGVDCRQDDKTMSDPEFLMDMLQIEDAIQDACQQSLYKEANESLAKVAARTSEAQDKFNEAWQERQMEEALDLVVKMQFLNKIYQRNHLLVQQLGGA